MKTKSYAVNNAFVLSCTREQLFALAVFAGITDAQRDAHLLKGDAKLRSVVGTKLANNPKTRTLFAEGKLEVELPVPASERAQSQTSGAQGAKKERKAPAGKSAKDWLRELLSKNDAEGKAMRYTLEQLVALTGKTEVNIRTMLSDLRSVKYAGKAGVFNTRSVREGSKVWYERA